MVKEMSNGNARDNLVSGNIVKTMLSLSIPAILGMVVIGLYNFMDAVFVGRMVGPEAMTAVKVSYPFTLLNSGISTLIGTGSASVLSRAIGKKDQETVDKIMGNLIALVVILSIIIMAVGLIFTRPLLMLSGAKGDILVEATRYLRIVFLGSLFVNFAQSSNMVMRGEGKLKTAMLIMGSGAILNIILDPILILAFGKENGILGAAVATISAQIFQAILAIVYFTKKSDTVKIHRIGII
ncbi:MAG: polysaccharide biosynthesis C-terminal domain-containing protein, partial [Lachnospiraceae bacterium]|nr:polysaccharide biosynthesis C-terminal domain-containing protein [Lachnospiraceae bacterium]